MKNPELAALAGQVITDIATKKSMASWLAGNESSGGGASLGNAFQQSTWVYACVSTLAENVSGIPFRILSGDAMQAGGSVDAAGPAAQLFSKPHPQLDRFQFWELLVSWMMLRGEVFVVATTKDNEVIRLDSRRAKIERLHILSPDHFREVVEGNELAGWQYTSSQYDSTLGTQPFLPEEVIHLKLPNPFNFWRGLSPLSIALLAAQTDYASAQFMKGLMLNNADTGVIVTTEQWLQPEQREQVLSALRDRKRKAGTADRPIILGGGLKVERPAISSADMQMLENRKFNRQEICAIFKVPQEMLGFSEDANRAIADAVRLSFMEYRIAPLCKRIEAGIDPIVKIVEGGKRGEFHVKGTPIMQAAQRQRVDTASKAFAMGVSVNELNAVYDLGFKETPERNKCYLATGFVEVGVKSDPAPTTPPSKEPAAKAVNELEAALNIFEALTRSQEKPSTPSAHDEMLDAKAKVRAKKLKRFFFEQRGRVLGKLKEQYQKGVVTKAIDDIFDFPSENEKLKALLKSGLIADFNDGAEQLFREVGKVDFKVPPERAIEWFQSRENLIEGINQTTFDDLKASLTDAMKNGESYNQMAARVSETYQGIDRSRAELIAQTETNGALNKGKHEGMVFAKVKKKWMCSHLAGTRDSHLQAEKDYVDGIPADEPFKVGGYEMQCPGDADGGAPLTEIANCRCRISAVL